MLGKNKEKDTFLNAAQPVSEKRLEEKKPRLTINLGLNQECFWPENLSAPIPQKSPKVASWKTLRNANTECKYFGCYFTLLLLFFLC